MDYLLLALAGFPLKPLGQFALQVERPMVPATLSLGGEEKYDPERAGVGAKTSLNPISEKDLVYTSTSAEGSR